MTHCPIVLSQVDFSVNPLKWRPIIKNNKSTVSTVQSVYWLLMVRGANSGSKESTCLSAPPPPPLCAPPMPCHSVHHSAPNPPLCAYGRPLYHGMTSCPVPTPSMVHTWCHTMWGGERQLLTSWHHVRIVELTIGATTGPPLPLLESACGCINCLHAVPRQMLPALCKWTRPKPH